MKNLFGGAIFVFFCVKHNNKLNSWKIVRNRQNTFNIQYCFRNYLPPPNKNSQWLNNKYKSLSWFNINIFWILFLVLDGYLVLRGAWVCLKNYVVNSMKWQSNCIRKQQNIYSFLKVLELQSKIFSYIYVLYW